MKTITKAEYNQLVGLGTLAAMHQKHMDDICLAVREITGEPEESYHATDFVFDGANGLREMLKRLDITVEKPPQAQRD